MGRLMCVSALFVWFSIAPPRARTQEQISWSAGSFRLDVSGTSFTLFHHNEKLVAVRSVNFNFVSPSRMTAVERSTGKLVLKCEYPPEANYSPETGGHSALIEVTLAGNAIRFAASPAWAGNTTIRLQDGGEHFFGILEELYPNNDKSPDLRGNVVDVDVLGNGGQYHENFSSVWSAFYMTNKGYASFFDTFAAGRYTLGVNGKTELYHHTGRLDWYVIAGSNGDELLKAYYEIIGRPKHVPLWACGPIAWRNENRGGKDEILNDIQRMTDLRIPFTAWFVDRPYSHGAEGWSAMDFDERFPNPSEWISTIRQKYGMEFMSWVGSLTFQDKTFPGLLPSERGYMDLTDSAAVNEFGRRLSEFQYSAGVRGHKLDRGDEYFPLMEPWHDRTPIPERRNKYIYLFAKTIDGYLRRVYGDDQVTFARGAYQRSQLYLTAVWSGDSRCSWDGLASSVANAVRCGFMGFPLWGSDVGGYLGGRIPEPLYARWLQLGAWSGLFEIKLDDDGKRDDDRPPWDYSERLQKIFKACADWRMELQPYLYSLANSSYKNGVAMKPLAYSYPGDSSTYGIWSEFQMGDAFLVAPILDSTNARSVYLPGGTWYEFSDPRRSYEGRREMNVNVPLEKIPVFVRQNSIYVTGVVLQGNSKLWNISKNQPTLSVFAYPGGEGSRTTFDYVDALDANTEKQITLADSGKTIEFTTPPLSTDAALWMRLDLKPSGLTVNGERASIRWEESKSMVEIPLTKGAAQKISITR